MISLSSIPGGELLQKTTAWRKFRHKLSLWTNERTNSHFTGFLRLPTQFEALSGPVVSRLGSPAAGAGPLTVSVLGCSNGAEAYTISSVLARAHPQLDFLVRGYDIDAACIATARTARYGHDEIFNNKIITGDFVDATFDRDGEAYAVKPRIAQRVAFDLGDVLDPGLRDAIGSSDVVFAQNFVFHLRRDTARRALGNISRLLHPGSAIFLDGVDLDLRLSFVRSRGLVPLDYRIEDIHNEARRARSVGWPDQYWGLEPFLTYQKHARERYATIFLAP